MRTCSKPRPRCDRVPPALYDADRLRRDVRADREMLAALLRRAQGVGPADDPKLRRLVELLRETDASQADRRRSSSSRTSPTRWTTSYSTSTASSGRISEPTRAAVCPRLARRHLSSGAVSWGFAPRSSEAPAGTDDAYDVLIATDALAEGQNLQQAGRLVNRSPGTRCARQRNGRIDRIGSDHETVTLHTFFPRRSSTTCLALKRLRRKIAQANAAVGVETPPLPGTAAVDLVRRRIGDDPRGRRRGRDGARAARRIRSTRSRASCSARSCGARSSPRGAELRRLPWGAGSASGSREGARGLRRTHRRRARVVRCTPR